MAFLIGGANSAVSGYDIDNSLRLDSASSAYLYRNQVDPTQEGQIYTISVWNKICFPNGQNATLLTGGYPSGSGSSVEETFFMHNVTNKTIFFQNASNDSTVLGKHTAGKYRDVSAWYHFMLSVDTTQGTDTNRLKVYVNGENVSANMTGGWPAEDVIHQLNQEFSDSSNQNTHNIGKQTRGSNYSDMYIADFAFVDGLQLAPSNFGETDEDSGIWKPKKPDVSAWGDNGFFLEFKNSAVGTGASDTIGADTSGNDNHFTSSGVATIDQTTDTPTNNFATLNPLSATATAFTEGNVHATNDSAVGSAAGTIAPSNGKWYFEVQLSGACNFSSGVVDVDKWATTTDGNIYDYDDSGAVAVLIENTDNFIVDYTEDTAGGSRLQNSVNLNTAKYGFALDLDSQGFYASANGNWYTGTAFDDTDFSNATNLANDIPAGTPMAFFVRNADGVVARCNFGNPAGADTISSGNADANGYGNFEYAVPSGYYALCTKNLAEYG